MTPSTYRDESHPPPDRRKSVLFCPTCGHESPIFGDWQTTTSDGEQLLVCTVCETVVDRRQRSDTAPQIEVT